MTLPQRRGVLAPLARNCSTMLSHAQDRNGKQEAFLLSVTNWVQTRPQDQAQDHPVNCGSLCCLSLRHVRAEHTQKLPLVPLPGEQGCQGRPEITTAGMSEVWRCVFSYCPSPGCCNHRLRAAPSASLQLTEVSSVLLGSCPVAFQAECFSLRC